MPWILIHKNKEIYEAEFKKLERSDRFLLLKRDGWSKGFDWLSYLGQNSQFTPYKLVLKGTNEIQGLIALRLENGYVMVDLIEKAPINRTPDEEFINCAEVLFGFACKFSKEQGYEGFISFYSKTVLVEHYMRKYGAELIGDRRLAIGSLEANRLIALYYK